MMMMAKLISVVIPIITLVLTSGAWGEASESKWGKTVGHGQEGQKTILQFYFHDNITGEILTAVKIAEPEDAAPGVSGFGKLFMADEPLTLDPNPGSKLVGRAQGMWGRSSMTDRSLHMSFTYFFLEGAYNGSSVSILGRNLVTLPVREMPVVGGTGLFRMARGYALAHTYFINTTTLNAVVGYNLTIFH